MRGFKEKINIISYPEGRHSSVNLVNAVQRARDVGADVVGIIGRDGGAVRDLASASILIPQVDPGLVTPQTEGLQALFWHLIVSHPDLAANTAKWEGIDACVDG